MGRRILILAVTAAQLALYAGLAAWRLGEAGRTGWAGLTFLPAVDLDLSALPLGELDVLLEIPGAVLLVVPGSPAARAGIEPGDVIVAVSGVPVTDRERLRELAAANGPGAALTYDLGYRRAEVTLASPFVMAGIRLATVSGLLLGTAYLAIGAAVGWARPGLPAALVLYGLSSAGAALFFLEAASRLDAPDLSGTTPFGSELFLWIAYAGQLVLLVVATDLLLHLALVFPRPRPVTARGPLLFVGLHVLPLAPLVAAAGVVAGLALAGLSAAVVVTVAALAGGLMLLVCLGILLLYSVATCGALYRNYQEGGGREKRQVLWPLWGILAALGGMLLAALAAGLVTVVSPQTGPTAVSWMALANRLLALLIPISFARGILE